MKNIIALVDCNNFFVSCERLLRPELEGKPVCVLSNNDGCIVSRSNEAKRLGVQMGAPYFIAKQHFKNVIFLSGNLPYYCEISKRVTDKLLDFTPSVEIYSIDEAFLDLGGLRKTFRCSYEEIIERIVKEVKNDTGIDVSVGLSYSKVLAKLANDKAKNLQKNGIDKKTYTIGYRKIETELKNTDISEVWGIGRNTRSLLDKYLIKTALDFVRQDDFWIKRKLGKSGLDLKQELLGNSINPVNSAHQAPKSVSRSESFREFQTDRNYIIEQLNSHIHKVCKKLRQENLLTSCIGVMLRTKDFQVSDVKLNLINPTDSEFEIMEQSKNALIGLFRENTVYRSVGFCAYKLTTSKEQQITLFEGENTLKRQKLSFTLDKLEEKYGSNIVAIGSTSKRTAARGDERKTELR